MNERTARWAWYGGSFVGAMVTKALGRLHSTHTVVAGCATAVWFLAWLARDNLVFKKEVAAQRERLAERRTAVRAAKDADAARRRAENERPSSQSSPATSQLSSDRAPDRRILLPDSPERDPIDAGILRLPHERRE